MSGGVAGGPSLWTRSVIDAKGTYPGSGWVITPCAQILQSLGTITGASHQELQCLLHNSDIESRVTNMCCGCGGLNNSDKCDKPWLMYN